MMGYVGKAQRERQSEYRRKPEAKAKAKLRQCLCCRKSFMSEGSHNRICTSCKSSAPSGHWNWG